MESFVTHTEGIIDRLRLKEITIIRFLTASALYIFFISDFVNKLLIYLKLDYSRVSIIPRSAYEILFLAVIIIFPNVKRIAFVLTLMGAFLLFIIGQTVFSSNVDFKYNFAENMLIFNKYFFVFIIYFGIYKLQEYPAVLKRVVSIMEYLFMLNAYLAIIGFVLDLDIFRTYINQPYRYGYSGILWVQNEASILYFLSISHFYYKRFILGQPSRKIYIVLLASVLLGTKAIYLFLTMLLVFHFLSHAKLRTKIVSIILVFAIYWFISWFLQTEQAKVVLAYFVSKMNTQGVWYMLFSGRTLYLNERAGYILEHWTFLNYLIGGQDQSRWMIEMDFFDLFFFMGAVGFCVYFLLIFTTIFKFSLRKHFNFFFVFSYMLLAFMGGHFFSSVINALYVCIISLYFYASQSQTYSPSP